MPNKDLVFMERLKSNCIEGIKIAKKDLIDKKSDPLLTSEMYSQFEHYVKGVLFTFNLIIEQLEKHGV